jgi:hypothetical protein
MLFGTVIIDSQKGYWIGEIDSTHEAVWIHHSQVADSRYLHPLDRFSCDLAPNPRKPGKMQAVNVRWTGVRVAVQRGSQAVQS